MDKKLPQSLTFWHGEFNNDLMANSNWNSKINRDFCWFNYREINVFHEAVFNLKLMDIPVPPVFNTAQCSGSATQHPPPHPPPQLWLPPIPYHTHLRALSTSMVLNAPIWLLLVFKEERRRFILGHDLLLFIPPATSNHHYLHHQQQPLQPQLHLFFY